MLAGQSLWEEWPPGEKAAALFSFLAQEEGGLAALGFLAAIRNPNGIDGEHTTAWEDIQTAFEAAAEDLGLDVDTDEAVHQVKLLVVQQPGFSH